LKAVVDSCPPETVKETVAVVVPEIHAEYPGGLAKMMEFILNNVVEHISMSQDEVFVFRRPVVQWVVDETGMVTQVQILKSSGIKRVDTLLVNAVKQMPHWTPAENAGKKVCEQIRIPLQICFK